ncbi:MAG: HAD-IA family hydrolase [Cyanobacteria bacterium P01_F01_bin.153]
MNHPTSPRSISHVIYDLDGLLLDTESINIAVSDHIATRYQRPYDPKMQSLVLGRDANASAKILVDVLDLPISSEEFVRQRRSLIATWNRAPAPMPGARELSRHLHRSGIAQAIATSSTRDTFEQKRAHHPDWFAIFETVVVRDDSAVKASKPAPDSFLVAAERLGANPGNCLVFEDSISGMKAAIAAGMVVVAVPSVHSDPTDYDAADLVLRSLEEFDPTPWNLPAFSNVSPSKRIISTSKVSLMAG